MDRQDDLNKKKQLFSKYNQNLQGTPDAYSESESDDDNPLDNDDRPKRANRQVDYKEVYSLCRNLLLKVERVVLDKNGVEITRKPTHKFSDVFDLGNDTTSFDQSVA